mmetsp:Transcript_2998/g.6242  ORF Transcript_2998/g.6242 Transcript_2998/m.6242 type:complete len:133 (-) Transcript_2998:311-709(-)
MYCPVLGCTYIDSSSTADRQSHPSEENSIVLRCADLAISEREHHKLRFMCSGYWLRDGILITRTFEWNRTLFLWLEQETSRYSLLAFFIRSLLEGGEKDDGTEEGRWRSSGMMILRILSGEQGAADESVGDE